MPSTLLATQATAAMQWDNTEPDLDAQSFYIEHLKVDLLPGTFVLLAGANHQGGGDVVARIMSGTCGSPCEVTVNIFKNLNDVTRRQGIMHPPLWRLRKSSIIYHLSSLLEL